MRQLACLGDKTTYGHITTATATWFEGNKAIAQRGDLAWCSKCNDAFPINGTADDWFETQPYVATGDKVLCRCPNHVVYGSTTQYTSSAPAAHFASAQQPYIATPVKATAAQPSTPVQKTVTASAPVAPVQSLASPAKSEPVAPKALTPELIAVAGSQHDNASGNKMMFIGQAVRELGEFKRSKPTLTRTLVVFTPSYNDAMLSAARSSAEAYGASLVTVTDAKELLNYLNSGKDRAQSPIEHLSFFSHGVPHRIAFGYHLERDYYMSIDILNYSQISPQAFSPTAQIDSYACRTGMGNRPEYPIEEAIQFFPQTNESLAQLLANHLRIKVRAFVRRSDYKNTWGSFEERQLGKLCGLGDDGMPGEEWCRRWKKLDRERQVSHETTHFTYQNVGATNPVISGDTPIGVPGGHFEFIPK